MEYFKEKNDDSRGIRQEKVNVKKFIYLGELPPNIDRYQLNQFILSQGNLQIDSIMIMGNPEKPFAYVKFKTKEDAETALKLLHSKTLQDHIIKAEPYSSKKDKKKLNSNLFVKNIPKDTTPKEIYDLFVNYGTIDSIKLKTNKKGECIGYGYINFSTEESAKMAIEKLNQTKFKDNTLLVSLFTPKEKRKENLENEGLPESMLIVKNIPEGMDDKSFQNTFDIYGEILICGIVNDQLLNLEKNKDSSDNIDNEKKDINDNSSNVYGVVLYTTKEEANAALKQLQGKYEIELLPIDNNIIDKVKKQNHEKMKAKYDGRNLVVKELPKEIDNKKFYDIFIKYGKIRSARVQVQGVMKDIKDKLGNIVDKKYIYESKGYGFILFAKEEDAQNAKEDLNGKDFEFEGMKLRLSIENFDYDKAEKAKLEQMQRGMGFPPRGGYPNNMGHFRGRGAANNRGGYHGFNNNMNNPMSRPRQNPFPANNPQNQKAPQKMPMPGPKAFQEEKITVESENLIKQIQEKLSIQDPEERTEAIGEILFFFLLKFIPQYGLNDYRNCDDSSLCSKLTGILIRTDTNNLLNIISSNDKLYNSLRDVVNKLNPLNNYN